MSERSWLAPLRRPIERVPLIAESYRLLRDYLKFRTSTPRELAHGFKLMGHGKMTSGRYELDETKIIAAGLSNVDVFVDIGANIGYYTCMARQRGVPVLAIEPSQTTLRFLYANLLANGLRDVEVLPVGLSSRVELAVLYGTSGTASLVPGWSRTSAVFSTVIPTTTLDRILAGRYRDQRIFIKIDIEGAEYECLLGASDTLARAVAPTWFVEIYLDAGRGYRNDRFGATFELFWRHGYTARQAIDGGAIVTPADVDRWIAAGVDPTPGANYLFTKV
jgi:FkbM family methyltransferase